MSFRPLARRTVRWRPVEGEGLEHLDLTVAPEGILACATVIGNRGGRPYSLAYRIRCDGAWRVTDFAIEASDGQRLALSSPAAGEWRDAAGHARPDLAGCIDIDLSGTPFTNTLPIRRLGSAIGAEPVELRMLYVPFDTLEPLPDGQRYTALDPFRLYRYEAADRSFAADLPVDEDGLVTDYPTLFERVR